MSVRDVCWVEVVVVAVTVGPSSGSTVDGIEGLYVHGILNVFLLVLFFSFLNYVEIV